MFSYGTQNTPYETPETCKNRGVLWKNDGHFDPTLALPSPVCIKIEPIFFWTGITRARYGIVFFGRQNYTSFWKSWNHGSWFYPPKQPFSNIPVTRCVLFRLFNIFINALFEQNRQIFCSLVWMYKFVLWTMRYLIHNTSLEHTMYT
jgi:hypothetical protein